MRCYRPQPISFETASKMFRIDDVQQGIVWVSDPYKKGGSAGKRPGYIMGGGYRLLQVFGAKVYEHQIVWLLTTGHWPTQSIDHINRVKDDNRAENLRLANQSQQRGNSQSNRKANQDLPRGVIRSGTRFVARIGTKNAGGAHYTKYIGSYKTVEDAAAAYNREATKRWGEYYALT